MTIRRCMLVVASIALLLAVGVEERMMARRAVIEIQRKLNLALAKIYAKDESFWRKSEGRLADLEASCLKRIEALSNMVRSEPEANPWNVELQEAKRLLDWARTQMANEAGLAASEPQLEEKHLDAASRPWEATQADPSRP
jgi:hypothetical protein